MKTLNEAISQNELLLKSKLDHHLDTYNGIMAGQATGDEHREMQEALTIAKILQIDLTTYEEERHDRPNE
tara:strand:- start:1649 stop:1858 length:210 start_codon:yes stop_codon:yes gene_type:complete